MVLIHFHLKEPIMVSRRKTDGGDAMGCHDLWSHDRMSFVHAAAGPSKSSSTLKCGLRRRTMGVVPEMS